MEKEIHETDKQEETNYQNMSDRERKQRLTTEQYQILRNKSTERAFTGPFLGNKATGIKFVPDVDWSYSYPIPSLIPTVVGLVFFRQ